MSERQTFDTGLTPAQKRQAKAIINECAKLLERDRKRKAKERRRQRRRPSSRAKP